MQLSIIYVTLFNKCPNHWGVSFEIKGHVKLSSSCVGRNDYEIEVISSYVGLKEMDSGKYHLCGK